MKVLIAEDDPIMLETIKEQLKKDDFIVLGTSDGREALQAFDSFAPDLLITDILMPYTSGLELIGIVRGEKSRPRQLALEPGHQDLPGLGIPLVQEGGWAGIKVDLPQPRGAHQRGHAGHPEPPAGPAPMVSWHRRSRIHRAVVTGGKPGYLISMSVQPVQSQP